MKNLLITLAALMLVMGCKKEDNTIYLFDEIKRKFSFKPGSYWIYRDSITGRVDSCYISNFQLRIVDFGRTDPWPIKEVLNISFIQKPKDVALNEEWFWSLIFYGGDLHSSFGRKINGEEVGDAQLFSCTYPIPQYPKQVYWEYPRNGNVGVVTQYPTLNLNGNSFLQVDNFYTEVPNFFYNSVTDTIGKTVSSIFLNDSVGLIKMRINYKDVIKNSVTNEYDDTIKINQVWELHRWKIVK
jgi:hypothetical protein